MEAVDRDFKSLQPSTPLVLTSSRRSQWRSRLLSFDFLFFNILAPALLLLFFAPLLAVVAIAIRLDGRGPVLFRQTRIGLHGKKFEILKFRTMHVEENGLEVRQATQGDPRVTSVGRLLRKTSIDELPQLINVLRGEMALIGPRPHAQAHDAYFSEFIPNYTRRFAVKPGLTGWAQVNGSRGETPTIAHMQRRVELDIWYIQNRSALLDFGILARTVLTVALRHSNAY